MRVTAEQLQEFIDLNPPEQVQQQKRQRSSYSGSDIRLDVQGYLSKYGVESTGTKQHGDSTLYLLKTCPFDSSHQNEASIGQAADGKLFFQCFHNSCTDRTWKEAREIISGSDSLFPRDNNFPSVPSVPSVPSRLSGAVGTRRFPVGSVGFPERPISELVKEYVFSHSCDFTSNSLYQELGLRMGAERDAAGACLRRLTASGKIKKNDVIRGRYSVVEQGVETMKLNRVLPDPFPLPLPFDLHNKIRVFPGDIVVIAGETNAGKTTVALNMVKAFLEAKPTENRRSVVNDNSIESLRSIEQLSVPASFSQIRYQDSEMGEHELSSQLHRFGQEGFRVFEEAVDSGLLEFIKRSHDWARVIEPNGLNVIDYMQVYDNFFEIGQKITDIRDQLQSGVAIVLIQKKTGERNPRGGEFALEKARVAILLSENNPYGFVLSLRKVKRPVDPRDNPQGKEIDYQFTAKGGVQPLSALRFVNQKQRKSINAAYQREFDQTPAQVEVEI